MKVLKLLLLFIVLMSNVRTMAAVDNITPAQRLPFENASYYHFAKDQSLAELIRDFFAMQGITVVVSDKVVYNANGRFSKMAPEEFWDYITKAYGLVWFFDGKIMFVYSNSELQTEIFRMDTDGIGTLSLILDKLGFVASDYSFRGVGEANVLIVTAPPQYITVIRDIASKFVPSKISDTTIVKVFPLKYAWAYDMSFNYANGSITVPGVATLLQSIITGQSLTNAFSPFNVSVGSSKKSVQYQPMLGILDDTPSYAKEMNKSLQKQNNDSKNSKQNGKTSEKNVADVSGATLPGFITCDQRLNAIIIRDSRENMPFYEDIIQKLDVSCEVIKIDVAVVNVNKNASRALGVNILGVGNGRHSLAVSTGDANLTPGTVGGGQGSIAGQFTNVVSGWSVNCALDALEQNGNGETLAKPSVLTLDNVAAIIETDKTQYSKVSGQYNSNAYSQTATTKLQVVPHVIPDEVDEDGKRKMKLFVDIAEGEFEDVGAGADPVITQHSLNTQAVLYEGQSLLIGGYNTEVHTKEDGGIPVLKDVPLVGTIFKHSSTGKTVKERIYVVSPSVVEIRSDDQKYARFLQDGELAATGTLDSDEYSLKTQWPLQRKSQQNDPAKPRKSGRNRH